MVKSPTSTFRVLASQTRRDILRILLKKELHVTGLARELGISVPVAAKHVGILERHGMVERRRFGRTHILRARPDAFYENLDGLSETVEVEIPRGANLIEALRLAGAEVQARGDREFIVSMDGEKGFYLYEVDGKRPDVTPDRYVPRGDVRMVVKKLVPVARKEVRVKVR